MRTLFNRRCEECNHQTLIYDELRGETFCEKCGLINADKYSFESIPGMMLKSHLEGLAQLKKLNEAMMKNDLE